MTGHVTHELEPQLLFEAADFSDGAAVCINYKDLPRDIAHSYGIECVSEKAFSIRDLMGGIGSYKKITGKKFVGFQALRPLAARIGREVDFGEIKAAESTLPVSSCQSATTWDLLGFQLTDNGLGPIAVPERRRIIGLGCSYETNEGPGYPYLFWLGNKPTIGLFKRSTFKFRPHDYVLYTY